MRKLFIALTVAVAAVSGFAATGTTYVWTGAQDAFWTNAANWTVGGSVATAAPGIPWSEVTRSDKKVDTISAAGLQKKGEKVEFGACSGATTIDFDGLYSIGAITVKAGAPTYTFGTSSTQVLPLESGTSEATSGKLTLEAGLENTPVMTAIFCVGAAATTRDTYVSVVNNTGKEFTLGDYGNVRTTYDTGWAFAYLYLSGTGNIRVTGSSVSDQARYAPGLNLDVKVPKVIVAGNMTVMHGLYLTAENVNVEILKGGSLTWDTLNGNYMSASKAGCKVTGEGAVNFRAGPTATDTKRGRVFSYNVEFEISAPFYLNSLSQGVEPDLNIYGNSTTDSGTVYFSGENNTKGSVAFIDGKDRACKGNETGLPMNSLVKFYATGTFAAAFATNTTLTRTFTVAQGMMASVANAGATNLTADITVTPLDDGTSATLCGKAETQPLVLNATYTDGQSVTLAIAGASVVSPSAATLEGASAIRLIGGTLDASAIQNWTPSVPVTFDTGASTVVVPDGEIYVLSSLTRTDSKGTVNFVCGTGRVKVTGATAGTKPAGVMVNGLAAEYREGGLVAPVAPATDVQIAARGDVVPNAPTQVVGITTEGTGGNDKLAADATAVKELAQIVAADATVEIGAGRNLTAGKVTLVGLGGNLDIGTAGDRGTFGAVGKQVQLRNDETAKDLTIRAKLADKVRVYVDGSKRAPVLAGGSAVTNDVVVQDGALKVTGDRTFAFDLLAAGTNQEIKAAGPMTYDPATWPTVRFDGAKDVVVGQRGFHASYTFRTSGYANDGRRGRIVVTNSLIRSDDVNRRSYASSGAWTDEYYSIVIGNRAAGWLEIQEGAVITNRIMIGSPTGGHRGLGFAWQTGGEVAALGDWTKGDTWGAGSGIGRGTTEGYYLLERGKLTGLGCLTVGMGSGFLRQKGGTFAVVHHPADTSNVGDATFRIGDANNADGHYWISAGTADFSATGSSGISMCGGYYKNSASRASVTADGTAFIDCGTKEIRMINTAYVPLAYPHYSFFNINDQAVVRAYGFYDLSRTSANEDTKPENRHVFVNFNGGTFRTSVDGKGFFHSWDPNRHIKDEPVMGVIDHVVVYAGGMKVDTDGHTGNFIDVPLEGATGGGVTAVNYTQAEVDAALKYDIPPFVEIYGDGDGATAVVDWDPATRLIKGVKITSAGTGYTYANAKFRIGPNSDLAHYTAEVTCDVAPNANTGAFTKMGEGTLVLEGTNTYGGATILAGGVLRIAGDGALPNGSKLVPQGGTMTVAAGVELPSAIEIDVSELGKTQRYDVLTFDELPATVPTFSCIGGGPQWQARLVGKTVRVFCPRGLVVIFR